MYINVNRLRNIYIIFILCADIFVQIYEMIYFLMYYLIYLLISFILGESKFQE